MQSDLLTILDALQEAQYYRFDDEAGVTNGCPECNHERRATGDDEALCEDHTSDKATAQKYAEVAARLISVTTAPKPYDDAVSLPRSSERQEAPTL